MSGEDRSLLGGLVVEQRLRLTDEELAVLAELRGATDLLALARGLEDRRAPEAREAALDAAARGLVARHALELPDPEDPAPARVAVREPFASVVGPVLAPELLVSARRWDRGGGEQRVLCVRGPVAVEQTAVQPGVVELAAFAAEGLRTRVLAHAGPPAGAGDPRADPGPAGAVPVGLEALGRAEGLAADGDADAARDALPPALAPLADALYARTAAAELQVVRVAADGGLAGEGLTWVDGGAAGFWVLEDAPDGASAAARPSTGAAVLAWLDARLG